MNEEFENIASKQETFNDRLLKTEAKQDVLEERLSKMERVLHDILKELKKGSPGDAIQEQTNTAHDDRDSWL